MRDKALEEAAFNLCKSYGVAIARCELCGRLPKMGFQWKGDKIKRVEAYCTGGRFFGKHTRVSAVVVNGKEGTDGFYTEAIDIWNELQMQDGYVRTRVMPGRIWDDD